MHTQINFPQNFIGPARVRRGGITSRTSPSKRTTQMPLDAQAAMHLAKGDAFVLENHDVDPGAPPSQVFFFTATPIRNPDGSTTYRVDQ